MRLTIALSVFTFVGTMKFQRNSCLRWIASLCLMAAIGGFPDLNAVERPNILFAISDDQSWMHTGANGDSSIRTPAFDRVAREGVRFEFAYCASPSCAPSRAALLTGRHIWQLEEGGILFGVLKPDAYPVFCRRRRNRPGG